MAAVEMFDYLSDMTPDYTLTTLSVTPTSVLVEEVAYKQITYETDDLDVLAVTLGTSPRFVVALQWEYQTPEDAGTILDFYFDAAKAKGMARSFYWQHPLDGHTYVVKFATPLQREYRAGFSNLQWIREVRLRVIGRKAEA